MTVPASAIPGPEASFDEINATGNTSPVAGTVSKSFIVNLHYLATRSDPYEVLQFGLLLLVEISKLEERVRDLEASIPEEVDAAKHEMRAQYEPIIATLEAKLKAHG